MAKLTARGDPTKDFFVHTITKDISLSDCIFDLVDNSIDGARKALAKRGLPNGIGASLTGYWIRITANKERFTIEDNGSGIAKAEAAEYAFRFGRRRDQKPDAQGGIGLYGIGLKRAMFKMGRRITVRSSTGGDSFVAEIDVPAWLSDEKWDFGFDDGEPSEPGTTVTIEELVDDVARDLGDQVFLNRLRESIGLHYAILLQHGLEITLNRVTVAPFEFKLLEGGELIPFHRRYVDEGVSVSITAGYSRIPKVESDAGEDRTTNDNDGWFVVCNDRVVVAADRGDLTVWGDDKFPEWHPQYNGFIGIVRFESEDPRNLPLTTTKRGVDEASPMYRRAVTVMKEVTREFIDYTNRRKVYLHEARKKETEVKPIPLAAVKVNETLTTPRLTSGHEPPPVRMTTINYEKPAAMVARVKRELGSAYMSNREAGSRTFDYFVRQEIGE